MENTQSEQISNKKNENKNTRKIILKVILGLGVISVLFLIAINYTQKEFSQLSEKVTAILEPNVKLIKLKEISRCLYGAEANVKAFTVSQDTTYLLNYEKYIIRLNSRLDTLLVISSKGKIVNADESKSDKMFSAQIDTLSELIAFRLDLFSDYIEHKSGKSSEDVLLK